MLEHSTAWVANGAIGSSGPTTLVNFTATDISPMPYSVPRKTPPAIGKGQAYYWSAKWQADEQETVDALERGAGRTFASGKDAIRWLLSNDE